MSGGTSSGGRRIAEQPTKRSRFDLITLVGVLALLLALAALSVQAPQQPATNADQPPTSRPTTRTDLVCPAGSNTDRQVIAFAGGATSGDQPEGTVRSRRIGEREWRQVDMTPAGPGASAGVTERPGATLIQGLDARAPGLSAGRASVDGRAYAECVAPAPDYWFSGAGSAGLDSSELVLTNPDSGPAVVEVEVWTVNGLATDLPSRGLSVPGNEQTVVDLDDFAPNPDVMTVRVSVVRGRVTASMEHTVEPATGKTRVDQLPAGAAPSKTLLIPALHRTAAERELVLTNPGDALGRVKVEVVGKQSAFVPKGLGAIRVPTGRVVSVNISKPLDKLLRKEDVSLRVTSTEAVSATLRSTVNNDLVIQPGLRPEEGQLGAIVGPPRQIGGRGVDNAASVVVSSIDRGEVSVRFVSATGPQADPVTRRVKAGTTTTFDVPADAVGVVLQSTQPVVAGVRRLGAGASVMPLRPLVDEERVPQVRPSRLPAD